MRQINKVSNRIIALLVCIMMLLSMLPVSIFTALAADVTSLSTNVDKQTYYVGQEHEFTYTTNVSAEDNGKLVVGAFKLLNGESIDVISTAIEKLWYWDTTSEQWAEFPAGYFQFGPPSGFPFNDGYTSKFKVKFKQSGKYKVVAEMLEVNKGNAVLASVEKDIVVAATASELQSDITTKEFEINATTEFTYTTVPNDLLNTMVLGTFTLKDSSNNDAQADVKLEYWNVDTNTWDEFYGDFGPASTGFPLVNATSKFKATFNKTGTYTVEAAMKKFDGGEILCTNKATIEVKDTTSPVISEITGAPTDWTKDDVTLTVVAEDNSSLVSQYRVNEGVWQNSAEFNVSANGTYKFEAKDASGNISFETITIDKIDKTAPNASVQLAPDALNPDGSWTKDEITVTINATENESGIDKYYVDGNPQTENTFKLTDSNDHNVKVVDKAGNESAVVTFSAKYDATAPVINDITGNPTEWTKDDVTLTVLATDTGCNGIQYKLDEGEWQSTNAFVVTENKDYTVYVKDLLGNTASEVVSVTKIDKSKPTISDYTVTTEDWTNQDVTVSGKFADNSGDTITAYYKVGTGSWQSLTLVGENKFEIIVSDECNSTYSVKAVDKAGNEFVSTEKTVKIDTTKATLTVNDVPAIWKNNQISVTGTVSDDASGIKTAKYSINSTNGVTDSGDVVITGSDYAFTTSVSKTGTYTYTITATDNAGNIKDVTTGEIKIDLADPTIDNVVPSISGWTNKAVTVTVTVSDTDSGIDKVYYKKDGGTETEIIVNEGIYAFTIPNSADDNSNYEIYCYDKAGNISAKSNYTAQIDVTNPSKPEIKYNKTAIGTFFETITFGLYKADIEVTITSSDALSGVKEIVYYKGTEEVRATPVDGKVVFSIAPNFKGKITATAVDNAGNNSEQTKGTDAEGSEIDGVIVDATIPVVDTADADKTVWTNTDIKITGTVSDNLSNVEKVFWRQGESTTENPATLNGDGTYEFIVPAQDYEGTISVVCYDYSTNKSVDKVVNLKMDITNPIVDTAVADITDWTNGNIKITGTVSDNLAGVEKVYWRQGESTTENAAILNDDGTFEFTVNAQNYYGLVYVGCYDNSANKSSTEKSVEVKMDVTDPTIDEAKADIIVWTNGDVKVTGSVSDNLAGVEKVYWKQGESGPENAATLKADGTYEFTISAQNYEGHIYIGCYDFAANKATESFVAVKMDTTIPVVDSGEANITEWTNEAITITGTVSDEVVNGASSKVVAVKYVYDNRIEQTAALTDGNYEFTIPATNYNGNVTIWCLDEAGNKSNDYYVAVKMDVQSPKVNTGVAVSDDWTNQAVVISGTVGDIEANTSISGVKTVKYLDTTGNPQTADSFISSTGEYTINIPATDYFGNINVWCEDNAGNRSDNYPVEVKMDVTAPSVPQIEYKQTVLNTVLEVITFGFFKADLEVVITSDDNFDSQDDTLKEIEFIYEGTKGKYDDTPVYKTGKPAVGTNNEITFTIPGDFRGTVKARAFDKAGNESAWTDEGTAPDKNDAPVVLGGVIVDETSPTRKVTYTPERILDATTMLDVDEVNEGDNVILYYKESATVKFEVTESNFYADDVIIKVSKNGEEAEPIVPNDWANVGNVWTGTIKLAGDGDYIVTMEYKDRSENEMVKYQSQKIAIDSKKPEIKVEYEPENADANGKYFKQDRKAIITVTEHNFRADDVLATITAKDVTDADVTITDFNAYLKTRANWKYVKEDGSYTNNIAEALNPDIHVAEITFATDAQYTFKFDSEDIIGNKADQYVAPDFVIDHATPNNLTIDYSKEIEFWGEVLETITFGFYSYNPDVVVTITADDITSRIDYFNWTYTRQPDVSTTNVETESGKIDAKIGGVVELDKISYSNESKTATTKFKLPKEVAQNLRESKQYRGSIKFTATDYAGNESAELNDDKRINIVDTIEPTRVVNYTDAQRVVDATTLLDVDSYTEGSDVIAYYNTANTVTMTVTEANFYKEDVNVTVTKNGSNYPIQVAWTDNSTDVHVGTFTLTEDGDYIVKVSYQDRSSNEMVNYESHKIVIDTIKPIISVDYENKAADALNVLKDLDGNERQYFYDDQTATITIEEHNFRADDVKVLVKAKDLLGNNVTVDTFKFDENGNVKEYFADGQKRENWSEYEVGTFRRADDTYQMTIKYSTDANYTFDIEYADLATNPDKDAETRKSDYFTVDKTAPSNLKVKYSTNVFENILEDITFGYYNAQMTVTISADDDISGVYHFVYSYLKKAGVSGVNAELIDDAIKEAGITRDGKTYTTEFKIPKLALKEDNQFNGIIEFAAFDRSENKSNPLKDESTVIVVDNITPTSKISYNEPIQKVEDVSYYAGDINATVVVTEANFYKEDVKITVTKDGATYPVDVKWVDDSVDVHTGTFTLTEDGDYIVNVVYKDRSQNEMIPYTSNQLTIDTKDPVINVSDVKHQSANNQETISFTVSVTDTNIALDSFKPTLTALIKKDNGSNSYSYETISIPLGTASTTVNNNGETVHSYTVKNLEVDGYYSLVCTAVDYANHSVTKINSADNAGGTASVDTMNFSVNRDGSVFWIETEHNDKYTGETFKDKLNGAYANDTVTIKLHEVNVDKVDENADKKTVFTLNDGSESEDIVLTEENYEKNVSVGTGGWYKNVYTLNNDNFDHDGVYSLNIITYDAATNSNVNTKTEAGTISFTLDRTKPVITANVKTEQRINDTEFPVEFKITETNLNAETISVTLKDRNGKTVETTVEELGNNEYKFVVNDGLNYSFEITAKDLAGNESEILKVERFTVSTNILVLWYANTPLFWGSIAGTIILAGAIIFFIFYKKKEQN